MDLEQRFKKETGLDAYILNDLRGHIAIDTYVEWLEEQLMLGGVVSSSDLTVVELSDDELKIITMAELEQWKQSAIEFDGFEGWIVRGRLIK
jgi:hypothetical protein